MPTNYYDFLAGHFEPLKWDYTGISEGPLFRKNVPLPERYIINEKATILFWENGKKTVVKRAVNDEFNPRLAFLTAFFQHYCGMSKNKANKYLASLEIEQPKLKDEKKPKHMKEEE